jgi:hypothetical protein
MEVVVKITQAALHREETSASIGQVAWWVSESVWTVLGKRKIFLVLTGVRTPDFAARNLTIIPL